MYLQLGTVCRPCTTIHHIFRAPRRFCGAGPLARGRPPGRPARTQEEPDQGVRRGRGRPPYVQLRLCRTAGQTIAFVVCQLCAGWQGRKTTQTLTVLHNGARPRCGAGWQPARRLVTAAGPLRARQWADCQSAAAYQAAPQCQICRSAWHSVFHEVSRAEGPLQQTTQTDRPPHHAALLTGEPLAV